MITFVELVELLNQNQKMDKSKLHITVSTLLHQICDKYNIYALSLEERLIHIASVDSRIDTYIPDLIALLDNDIQPNHKSSSCIDILTDILNESSHHPINTTIDDTTILAPSEKIYVIDFNIENQTARFNTAQHHSKIFLWDWSTLHTKNKKLLTHLFNKSKLPLCFNLHGLHKKNNQYQCDEYICLPDFLIDVTSIAECVSADGVNFYKHLLHLFHYESSNLSLLIGTTVNDMFDALIVDDSTSFDLLIQTAFYKSPLSFCLMDEAQVKEFFSLCKSHYDNLKTINNNPLNQWKIDYQHYSLEPSYYSVDYGIQGRLDAYFSNHKDQHIIVELKSGKPFRSNGAGINYNHQAQITLYNQIIHSVYGDHSDIEAYILYSSQVQNMLRKSAINASHHSDTIYARNGIIFIHISLMQDITSDKHLFDLFHQDIFSDSEKFSKTKAADFCQAYIALDAINKSYFKQISRYIAKEQNYSKLGKYTQSGGTGLASLWLQNSSEKSNSYNILENLILEEVLYEESEFPILIFRFESTEIPIHNFRIGDTLVLYENKNCANSILKQQVYKSTLVNIIEGKYYVRLRTRIFDDPRKNKNALWNIEHDVLDKSYLHAYQNAFAFIKLIPSQQNLWLGINPPRTRDAKLNVNYPALDPEFNNTLHKIVNSRDYYLLWGPPGTGKTSVIVKYTTHYLVDQCSENVLLLAYTNRAVDEMCDAVCSWGNEWKNNLLRIGSRYSVNPSYAENLLDYAIQKCTNRKEIKTLLDSKNIFCATIASILGKRDIFSLKKFDTVIIDEASQILEPQLIAWIGQFARVIFIGDHLQLPAVSLQSDSEALINDPALNEIGIHNFNQSLFERLYLRCELMQWTHAYSILERQGRMHYDIMTFPSFVFYQNQLSLLQLNNNESHTLIQQWKIIPTNKKYFYNNRLLYYPVNSNPDLTDAKVNKSEAKTIVDIILDLQEIYIQNNIDWTERSCGIITPFRAQIYTIQNELKYYGLDSLPITIDTVERYQGGARDIIILSTCINHANQLDQITSPNHLGLDRKLNVAITRTRELFILVGNHQVLTSNEAYNKLIEASYTVTKNSSSSSTN